MNLFSSLVEITKHVLSIVDSKESKEYAERVLYLEKLKYQEEAKDENKINHALLDNIDNELCLIAQYASSLKVQKA